MSGDNCGLCLCCGAPFPPLNDDVVEIERLGNMCILHLHRKIASNERMRNKFNNPTLFSKKDKAHMLHQAHHRWAVEIMSHERLGDADLTAANPVDPNGIFCFTLNPKSERTAECRGAYWARPADEVRLNHDALARCIMKTHADDSVAPRKDYDLVVGTCKNCNITMTMDFWFRFHLYGSIEANPDRLIQGHPITLHRMDTHGQRHLDNHLAWTTGAALVTPMPLDRAEKSNDIKAPAVGYYLHMCLPVAPPEVPEHTWGANKRALYLHMCWVVLEVACLTSEYQRGNRGRGADKLLQGSKTHLGAIELYLSYFAYRILEYRWSKLRRVGFRRWHQQYVWFGWKCRELFASDGAEGHDPRLWAFQVMPASGAEMSSRELIEAVSANMVALLRYFKRIARCILHPSSSPPPVVDYFLPQDQLEALMQIASRGTAPDFDSFVEQIGIDCMFMRVLQLACDYEESILREMRAFVRQWHRLETDNVLRNSGNSPKDRDLAAIIYRFCKLGAPPPEDIPSNRMVLAELLRSGDRCPWASARALHDIGAFDFSSKPARRLPAPPPRAALRSEE